VLNSYPSELNRRPLPRIVARPGASERLNSLAPAVTSIAPWAAPPNIQQPLAHRIEAEKSQYLSPLRRSQRMVATDEFVVRHAAVCQNHGSPRLEPYPGAERQARPEHQRIQQITFKSQVFRHGTVVEWARQGRDEIHLAGGPAFEKTASRDLDDYLYLWRICRCLTGEVSNVLRVVHAASLLHPFWSQFRAAQLWLMVARPGYISTMS
jgi:hypothetical protein